MKFSFYGQKLNELSCTQNLKTSLVNSSKFHNMKAPRRMTVLSDWDNGSVQKINLEIKQHNEFLGNYQRMFSMLNSGRIRLEETNGKKKSYLAI